MLKIDFTVLNRSATRVLILILLSFGIATAYQSELDNKSYLPAIGSPNSFSSSAEWPTVAANSERTSWTPEQVTGNLNVLWYRPIEAYIPQNSQVITANGLLYISTARGLYALNAASGAVVWRYDTEMPLGNSPTVSNGVVYVGGYDRKLHALDALTGSHLWAYSGAKAGFDTNPLVVNGKVIAGNRDGNMYAIGAHGTGEQGNLLWKFQTQGAIHLSAAFKDGIVYFASNDNFAYALNASNGQLIWRSLRLPGMQFQSYWPVIYKDLVIFSVAPGYRYNQNPGGGVDQRTDIFGGLQEGTLLGQEVTGQEWSHGYPVIEVSSMTQYLEDNPTPDTYKHKPWRRTFVALHLADGSEYSYDSDLDGYPEYIPASYHGTGSGNRYPAVVGSDDILYFSNLYQCCSDSMGRVMGWNPDHPGFLSVTEIFGAVAEPQAISAGGNVVYRNLCCDRVGDWTDYTDPSRFGRGLIWSYNLHHDDMAPGYDPMWTILSGLPRLKGWYTGNSNSANAAYHNHGDQNPIVPYGGNLYVHRSNTIIAFGPGPRQGALPPLTINPVQDSIETPSRTELIQRLENEIQKMIEAGHLRPGYYNVSGFNYRGLRDYFSNPGDTLYTLSIAFPYLSTDLQAQVLSFLDSEFETYFVSESYGSVGWNSGAAREDMILPPEVEAELIDYPPGRAIGWSFLYPQHNFYALWKYADLVPEASLTAYNIAKSNLEVPLPDTVSNDLLAAEPFQLNAWIAGYIGFLELQKLAGMDEQDAGLGSQVADELARLLQFRVEIFSKDSPWTTVDDPFQKKHLDIARNFMYLVPELADYLAQNIPDEVQQAVDEYQYIAPYWFASRYEAVIREGVMSNLYNYHALFTAKARILNEPRQELTKYLDVSAFARGDLFYIQNLIAAIEASDTGNISELAPEAEESCPL